MWDWFYNIPTVWSFIIFVTVITIISLVGLYMFKLFNIEAITCSEHNNIVGIFIAIISVFLGVMLTFIVVEVSNNYDRTRVDAAKEAASIFLVYQTLDSLPDTENIQSLIVDYLEYVIDTEYPGLKQGNTDILYEGNLIMINIENELYAYNAEGERNLVLYGEAIDLLNQTILYRLDRIDSGTMGINNIIWIITIVDSVLLLLMSWFLLCSNFSHYILTGFVAIYIATAVYLALVLSYPFRGSASIPSDPFVDALNYISVYKDK